MNLAAELEFESRLESVDQAEERVLEEARKVGLDEEETFRLGYAVREAMVNAVVHGNRYNTNKRVSFQISVGPGAIEVRVRDHGDGFEVAELADPLAQENLLNQCGRGLTLIRAFVDDLKIVQAQGGGTMAILRKTLQAEGGGE